MVKETKIQRILDKIDELASIPALKIGYGSESIVVESVDKDENVFKAESPTEGLIGLYSFSSDKDEAISLLRKSRPEIDAIYCKPFYLPEEKVYMVQYSPYFFGDKVMAILDDMQNKQDSKRYTMGYCVSLASEKDKSVKVTYVSHARFTDDKDHIIIYDDKTANEVIFKGTFEELADLIKNNRKWGQH